MLFPFSHINFVYNHMKDMSLNFKGEDLVMMLLAESECLEQVEITFRRLNSLREKLREHGISHDLGIRELESLNYVYPDNITINQINLTIIKSATFVEYFKMRAKTYDRSTYNELRKMWEDLK